MKPKKILTQLLLIGAAGSVIVGVFSCGGANPEDPCPTMTFHFEYQNQTDKQIDIKIYRKESVYEVTINKGQQIIQTVRRSTPEDFIRRGDSIYVKFPEVNKGLWYKGPPEETTDKRSSSPYVIENYIKTPESKCTVRYSFSFTQKHLDIAEPTDQ